MMVDSQALGVALWGLAVLTLLGLFSGFALAAAAMRFKVTTNPLVDRVRANLPSANCGACGFVGCQPYAEAVVENPEVAPNLCTPGRGPVAGALARLTDKEMGSVLERMVVMRCHGTSAYASLEAEYAGVRTCAAASLVFGGPKACKNGCLGLGDCVRVCPFDALTLGPEGIAVVDAAKCTGCALCVPVCPKELFELYPSNRRIELACVARDKKSVVRSTCVVGCTLCRKCVAACPADAVEWDGATMKINHDSCLEYGSACNEACVDICPSTILHRIGQRPEPEAEEAAAPAEV